MVQPSYVIVEDEEPGTKRRPAEKAVIVMGDLSKNTVYSL